MPDNSAIAYALMGKARHSQPMPAPMTGSYPGVGTGYPTPATPPVPQMHGQDRLVSSMGDNRQEHMADQWGRYSATPMAPNMTMGGFKDAYHAFDPSQRLISSFGQGRQDKMNAMWPQIGGSTGGVANPFPSTIGGYKTALQTYRQGQPGMMGTPKVHGKHPPGIM